MHYAIFAIVRDLGHLLHLDDFSEMGCESTNEFAINKTIVFRRKTSVDSAYIFKTGSA